MRTRLLGGALSSALLCTQACGSAPGEPAGPPQPYPRPEYTLLSQTGLFVAPGEERLEPGVAPYTPNYALWSDGASKARWVSLPEGGWIDTSDMNHWVFPVGTRVWKEFSLGGARLETRLVERYGLGPDDYWMGAFVWQEDQRDAVFAAGGQQDVLGTSHDAPPQLQCNSCHEGEPGRVLGLSALQLAPQARPSAAAAAEVGTVVQAPRAEGELTLEQWVLEDRLSAPPPPGARYAPPGDEVTAAALGYLHANCGNCHNPFGRAWRQTHMLLRLDVESMDVESCAVVQSVVGKPLDHFESQELALRVEPGRPESSAILARMQSRQSTRQMPPLATEKVDDAAIERVTRWVMELPGP